MTSLREQILSSLRSKVLKTDIVQDISGSAEMPMILAIRPHDSEFEDMVVCVWLQDTADTPPPSHQALLDTIGGDDTLRHKFFLLSSFEDEVPPPERVSYADWLCGTPEDVADIIAQSLATPRRDVVEQPGTGSLQAADDSDVSHSHPHGEDAETGGDVTSPPSDRDLLPQETNSHLHAHHAESTDDEAPPHPDVAENFDDGEKEPGGSAAEPLDANDRPTEQEPDAATSLPVEQPEEHASSHIPPEDVDPSGANDEDFPDAALSNEPKEEGGGPTIPGPNDGGDDGANLPVTSDTSEIEPSIPTPAPTPMEEPQFASSDEAGPQAEEMGGALPEDTVSASQAEEGAHGIADANEPEEDEEDEEDDGLPAMGSFPTMPINTPSGSLPAGQGVTVNSGVPTLSTGGAPPLSSSDAIIMAMAATMSAIIGGSPCMFSGVEYSIHDLTDARGMLPVILVSAAQWACPLVLKTKGKGGFSFSMRSAQEDDGPSLLGFVVTALELSSPQTFLMAVAAPLEQCIQFGGEGARSLDMTPLMESFAMWGDHWGLFADDLENEDSFPAGGAE